MKNINYNLYTDKNIKMNSIYNIMIKSGLIRELSIGLYIWMPTGTIVLNKIKNIIIKYMKKIDMYEIIMPILQPIHLWEKSNRYYNYYNELIQTLINKKNKFILSPTNEEAFIHFIINNIKSYKNFPIKLFQINNKFRNEIRPNNKILRSIEFIMKDGYSLHNNYLSLNDTYYSIYSIYKDIFNILKIKFNIEKVNSKFMGGNLSHEFKSLSSVGNTFNKNNIEYCNYNINNKMDKGIEIAHIFRIGNRYSNIYKNKLNILMGSYGIGISRLLYSIIEHNHDNNGIFWPKIIQPFDISLIPLDINKSNITNKIANNIYYSLSNKGINVFYNKSINNIAKTFYDMDLIGIPYNLIFNENHIKNNIIEIKKRSNNNSKLINLNEIIDYILKRNK